MILPGSYFFSLVLLVASLLLAGSWANTFKLMHGKWRFELYYFDFAVGAFMLAVIAGLTVGSLGFDGFSFADDLRLAGKRQDLFAFVAGGLFNAGNMLMVGGMSLTALSTALPIGMSAGLLVAAVADLAFYRQSSPWFVVSGSLALVVAIVLLAVAWQEYATARLLDLVRQGKTKTTRRTVSLKGVTLSVLGGVLLGAAQPFVNLARVEDAGLGPYSLGFVFAAGILLSTFVMNLFFMNLPVAGEPIDVVVYFQARASQHLWGVLGGMLLMAGVLANLAVARTEGAAVVPARVALAITQTAIVVAALWGLVAWKELRAEGTRVSTWMSLALVLVIAGIGLCSLALPVPTR
jgi:glucose uptake protein